MTASDYKLGTVAAKLDNYFRISGTQSVPAKSMPACLALTISCGGEAFLGVGLTIRKNAPKGQVMLSIKMQQLEAAYYDVETSACYT